MATQPRVLLGLLFIFSTVVSSFAIAAPQEQAQPQAAKTLYIPLVLHFNPVPFGVEVTRGWIAQTAVRDQAQKLGVKWLRLNAIQWRLVQPTRESPYDVTGLARFERDLQAALAVGLTPVVIVNDSPAWATINQPYQTSCGAIREDRLADFAAFMGWLAARYRQNVQYWEIGNEPDVDPRLVPPDAVFGCWGNIADPYYGGERYGSMLKAVTPAIKRSNPIARVVVGGLALLEPESTNSNLGKPEKFFEGILRAGAGHSFDSVAYHSYPAYTNRPLDYDYDRAPFTKWAPMGGFTLGKAKFLRATMAKYGVDKPLMLNETSLTCPTPPDGICSGVGPTFYSAQSAYIIRMMTRAWSIGVQQIMWYTLHGPGWFNSGLLDERQSPRPVYHAYEQYIAHTSQSEPPVPTQAYDRDDVRVEAYRFNRGLELVDIVWAKDLSTYYVKTPPKFTKAYDQYGVELTPIGPYLPVNFRAIYIHHLR